MLREIAVGVVVGFIGLGLALACSAPGQLTPLARCQLEALRVLPDDPEMVTVFDGVDIVRRLHACKHARDAGP